MGILSIFGYDRKTQDARVDAAKLARDQAIQDSYRIEKAAGYLRSQTGILESQAGQLFAAAGEARAIGSANASRIRAEGAEAGRRRGLEQKSIQSMSRAVAAASGIRIDTGGSSDIYRGEQKKQHGLELAWMNKAAVSQANIATMEGEYSAMQAEAAGTGVLAGIPGIMASAEQYMASAASLRTGGDVAVAEARAGRAASRSGAYLAVVGTALSVVSAGASLGLVGAGSIAFSASTKAILAGVALAGGIAAVAGARSASSKGGDVGLDFRAGAAPTVAGVTAAGSYQAPELPGDQRYNAPPPLLPSAVAATAESKKQYLAQTKKQELNIFGSASNPLAMA